MLDFRKLALLSDEELGRYDIVETHLACAAGLPGAEKIDQARCIAEIDRLTEWVRRYTEHCLAHPDPANQKDSPGVFRMRAMLTCLWKGAKIRYNPAKIPDDAPWGLEDCVHPRRAVRRRRDLRHAADPVHGDRPATRLSAEAGGILGAEMVSPVLSVG